MGVNLGVNLAIKGQGRRILFARKGKIKKNTFLLKRHSQQKQIL